MSNQMFTYAGPATIDGVTYPSVILGENPRERGLRSWAGTICFTQEDRPEGFTGNNFGSDAGDTIELPDGRTAKVLITDIQFDGSHWNLELIGTGPTPS